MFEDDLTEEVLIGVLEKWESKNKKSLALSIEIVTDKKVFNTSLFHFFPPTFLTRDRDLQHPQKRIVRHIPVPGVPMIK